MNINNISQSLRLREYYYMALRHKLLFAVVVGASVIIATFMAFTSPKIYQAETVLLVEGERILDPLINGLAISPSVGNRMRTMRDELLSWQRLTLLVEKLELFKKDGSPLAYERLIRNLRENISIKMRGTDIITVAFEGQDPKKAQEIVQTLSDIIIDGNLTSADLEANSAIRFIQQQLETYRQKLEESEIRLREFREIYSSSLPIAVRMNEQMVALKMELNNLLVDNTEDHPRVIQTRKLIEQLESQRDQYIRKAQDEGADIKPEDYAKLVTSVPLQEQQLAKLQRDYSVNESIYQRLLQRLETAKISQTLEESDNGTKFKILEPARLPLVPVKPNKPMMIIGGLIVGFGLGVVLIYLIEMSNTSIRTMDEARNLLELPVFAAISTIRTEELLMGERLKEEIGV
jgi:polysaccharide biosynthesis transport protein